MPYMTNHYADAITSARRHQCTWCGEQIALGSIYYSWRNSSVPTHHNGPRDTWTSKMHPACFQYVRNNWANRSPYEPGTHERGSGRTRVESIVIAGTPTKPAPLKKEWTLLLVRVPNLQPRLNTNRLTEWLLCRIEAPTYSRAEDEAVTQCRDMDFAAYTANTKAFQREPRSADYRVVSWSEGFPAIRRIITTDLEN